MFAVYDNAMSPLGFAGIVQQDSGDFQTATYLAPNARRKGVNTACKHMQYSLGKILGISLGAGVKNWNEVSIRAMNAHWPDIEPTIIKAVSTNGVNYSAYCWQLPYPPVKGKMPTEEELTALTELIKVSSKEHFRL